MDSRHPKQLPGLPRRDLLKTGVAAGAMMSAESVLAPRALRAQPKRGGILRAWGYDPPHFDPHLVLGGKTHNTVSFVYSRLVRHKVGAGVTPGNFILEPDLAECWEQPDETTYVFRARRLLAEAGFPRGLKTQLSATSGLGTDLVDAVQLVQRQLKEVGIDAELKIQEFGAYVSTTLVGKFDGMAMGPFSIAWEPHSVLYGMYLPEQPRNNGHVADGKIVSMLREQMRTQNLEARRNLIFDIQRYAAEQQHYVYLYCVGIAGSWQPYVKNYAPNPSFDYGSRAAALWLDKA